jgi:DnaJ-domain-containing protein 1
LSRGGQEFRSSWEGGQVIAATSPSPADSIGRVALNAGLATTTLLGSFLDQSRRQPDRDQLALFVELARLQPRQTADLKRRLMAQRALRMFGVPGAGYSVNNARSMRAEPELGTLDVRWLIYQGIRLHYPIERLQTEMGQVLAHRFRLAADAMAGLAAFGFGEVEQTALFALQGSALSANELVVACPGLDKIKVLALVYALVASDCLEPGGAAPEEAGHNPLTAQVNQRIGADELAGVVRAQHSARGSGANESSNQDFAGRSGQSPAKSSNQNSARPTRLARPSPPNNTVGPPGPPVDNRPRRRRRSTAASRHSRAQKISTLGMNQSGVTADEVRWLIDEKARLVDESANHYRLLGVQFGAGDSDVRIAYFKLAKRLHPDRLQALGVLDSGDDAQRVFAAINQAFQVLSDRRKAAEYRMMLEAGGLATELDDADAEQVFARILAAEEAFRLGEMALKRSHWPEALERFEQAVDLNPQEGEHFAYLAWTQWCAADDKKAVLAAVGEVFATATEISPKSPVVFLLRAHVARQAGDLARAERLYRKVLKLEPSNTEAETELRILQTQKR